MRVLSVLIASIGLCSATQSAAQQTSTYLYDVHGRLVVNATAGVTGNSNLSNYAYDSAGNRASKYSVPIAPRAVSNQMMPGEQLLPGQAVVSNDGQSRLEFRLSGEVMITCNGVDQRQLYGPTGRATQLIMQAEGNLVLYSYFPTALWWTSVGGNPGAYLIVQDDGHVVIYDGSTPIWWSSTFC